MSLRNVFIKQAFLSPQLLIITLYINVYSKLKKLSRDSKNKSRLFGIYLKNR